MTTRIQRVVIGCRASFSISVPPFAIAHDAMGKTIPAPIGLLTDAQAFRGRVLRLPIHGVHTGPILHFIDARARLAPIDTQSIDLVGSEQIQDDPLRMQRVVFAGKCLGEVWIALPKRGRIAVRNPPVTFGIAAVRCRAAMRQRVSKGIVNETCGLRVSDKVAGLVRSVAPRSIAVPMPSLDG
jgi:hypothetical protein